MSERNEDQDNTQAVDVIGSSADGSQESLVVPKTGRSRKVSGAARTEPDPVEGDDSRVVVGEESLTEVLAVVEDPPKMELTIKELEMMPKIEELSRLEEVHVGGTTNIQPEVIGAIAGVAAQAVEGVASLGTTSLRRTIRERMGGAERKARGIDVEVGRREVILDINLRVIYGYSIPDTVIKVREKVADRLVQLCGLLAKEINISVSGLEFPDRIPGRVQ